MSDMAPFDVLGPLPDGLEALEASAGTGKTWTIAALVVRYVAEGVATIDQILVVTFTRAATAELRARIRARLAQVHRHLADAVARQEAGDPQPATHDVLLDHLSAPGADLEVRRDRVEAALASFDSATITTIHGFCQRVLSTVGHVGDVDGQGRLLESAEDLVRGIANDLHVAEFHDADPDEVAESPTADLAVSSVLMSLGHPDAPVLPALDAQGEPVRAMALARMVAGARRRLDQRKRALGVMTFDDLLHRLADTLEDPVSGPAVVEAMQRRFSIGLIDEFQDTDPVQWRILRSLFEGRPLVLIGDPKQAIYKFRGADVQAYLEARSAGRCSTLATNFRSDDSLVVALGHLFDGTTFGDPRIRHLPVAASHEDGRFVAPDGGPPLQLRARLQYLAADTVRGEVAADLAAEITRLLASGATIAGPDGTPRPIVAADCAVLVRTNAHAELVGSALATAGVPSVVNGVGSVLDQPAAADWQVLLGALERPSATGRVRGLALTPLMGWTADEVAELDDDDEQTGALHDRVHGWARVARDQGIASLVRAIIRDTDLLARVLGCEGGERWLTDFEHLGELLHAAAAAERLGPAALASWLHDQGRRDDELPAEQLARRLESDARAVQVMTIHRAKGLQFPFVYVPFVMSEGMGQQVPLRYRDPATGEPTIDLGSSQVGRARQAAEDEARGELLRVLYVALTRAEHRLVVWWFPLHNKKETRSPLSKVLFGTGEGDTRARHDADVAWPGTGKNAKAALDRAFERFGSLASWTEMPDEAVPVAWSPPATASMAPEARVFGGRIDRTWTRASYSGLIRPRRDVRASAADLDEVPGRHDEADVDAGQGGVADGVHPTLPLGTQPAGALFGTTVHAVIEHVDLAAVDLEGEVNRVVGEQVRRSGVTVPDLAGLAAGLLASLTTPLGPAFGDVMLAGTARGDRLDELDFEMPLAHGRDAVTLPAVAELLRQHLVADDLFATYPDRLDDPSLLRHVRGWLAGSVDLVLRRHTEQGKAVFHVIDHKSNRLHTAGTAGTTWDYRPESMAGAMMEHHYVLQALIYQVAVHRFLRWRLPDYQPQEHLGAVGYLFLRGLVGPQTPLVAGMRCGMFAWQPPGVLVTSMSDLLEVGDAKVRR